LDTLDNGYLGYVRESGDIWLYVMAVLIYLASTVLWSFRWKIILSRLGSKVRLSDAYTAIMGGILVNNISPSLKMGGEGFRAAWIKIRCGIPLDRGLLTIMYERLTEIPGLLLVLGVAIKGGMSSPLKTSITGLIGVGVSFKESIGKARKLLKETWKRLRKDTSLLSRDIPLTIFSSSIAILIWIQDIFRFYLIAHAVGVPLTIPEAAVLSIGYLIFGLGPTPAGIGFVEGGLISLLAAMGVPAEKAGLIVLGERLISSLMSSGIGFLLVILMGGREAFKAALRISRKEVAENGVIEDNTSI